MGLRHKSMMLKTYVHRTTTYISLINSGMLLFLFLSKLKEAGLINADLDKLFFPLFIGGFFCLLLLGWFEINKLQGKQKESEIGFDLTPQWVDIHKKINYLYDKEKENEKE